MDRCNTFFFDHLDHLDEDLGCSIRIITSSMVMLIDNTKLLAQTIQCIFTKLWKQDMRQCHRIHNRTVKHQSQPLCILPYKSGIKGGIVRNYTRIANIL